MDQTTPRSVVQFGREHLAAMDKVHHSLRGQFHKIVHALVKAMPDITAVTPNAFHEVGVHPSSGVYVGALAPDAFHFALVIQFGAGEMSCAVGIRVDIPQKESVALRRDAIMAAVVGLKEMEELTSAFNLPEEAKLDRKKALRELLGEDGDGMDAPRQRRQYAPPAPRPAASTLVDPGMVLGGAKRQTEEKPMNGSDSTPERLTFRYLDSSSDPVDCVVALAHAIHPDAAFSYTEFSAKLEAQWPEIFPKEESRGIKALYNARLNGLIHEINPSYGKITRAGTTHAEKLKTRPAVASASREASPNSGAKAPDIPWTQDVSSLSRGKIVGGIALHLFGRKLFDRDSVAEKAFADHGAMFDGKMFNVKNAISGLKSAAYGWFEDAPGGRLRLTDKGFEALAPLVGLAPPLAEPPSSSREVVREVERAPRVARKPSKARVSFDDGPVLERYPDPATAEDACNVILAIGKEVEARKTLRERDLLTLDKEIAELEEEARTIQAEVEVLKKRRGELDETIPALEERKKAILKLMPDLG